MIEKNDIDAYMSIKAPDSIKERILEEQAKNDSRISTKMRMCYALAAALLVIVAVFAFFPGDDASLYYNGELLDKSSAIIKMADNPNARIALLSLGSDADEIPFSVKTDKKTKISVSRGSLTVLDGEGPAKAGSSITVDSDTNILWTVELISDGGSYTLTVGDDSYSISENNKAQWVLSKK